MGGLDEVELLQYIVGMLMAPRRVGGSVSDDGWVWIGIGSFGVWYGMGWDGTGRDGCA